MLQLVLIPFHFPLFLLNSIHPQLPPMLVLVVSLKSLTPYSPTHNFCMFPFMWAKSAQTGSCECHIYSSLSLWWTRKTSSSCCSGSIASDRLVTPLLACWALQTKIPKCSQSSYSFYFTAAVCAPL